MGLEPPNRLLTTEAKVQCCIKTRLLADLAATMMWIAVVEQADRDSDSELAEALDLRYDLLRQIRAHEANIDARGFCHTLPNCIEAAGRQHRQHKLVKESASPTSRLSCLTISARPGINASFATDANVPRFTEKIGPR